MQGTDALALTRSHQYFPSFFATFSSSGPCKTLAPMCFWSKDMLWFQSCDTQRLHADETLQTDSSKCSTDNSSPNTATCALPDISSMADSLFRRQRHAIYFSMFVMLKGSEAGSGEGRWVQNCKVQLCQQHKSELTVLCRQIDGRVCHLHDIMMP